MRPSWGSRRSAMSRFDMILIRDVMAASSRFGGDSISWSTPSMRNRMRKTFSYGSQWMSLAPFWIASTSTMLTSFTTGASSADSFSSEHARGALFVVEDLNFVELAAEHGHHVGDRHLSDGRR